MTPPETVARLLEPEEKMLWLGQPRPYVFLLRGLPQIAYGITWAVLGAFWYHGSGGVGRYAVFEGWYRVLPLVCIPFILAGFSFFFYPIRLGAQARRTWYVVTDRRIFIAELPKNRPPHLRVFTADEMCPPRLVKRLDGLHDLILTQRALDNPHLAPRLDAGFFGLDDGVAVLAAIEESGHAPVAETGSPAGAVSL